MCLIATSAPPPGTALVVVSGKEEAILVMLTVDTLVTGAYDDYFGGPYSSYGGFGGFQDKKESGGVH